MLEKEILIEMKQSYNKVYLKTDPLSHNIDQINLEHHLLQVGEEVLDGSGKYLLKKKKPIAMIQEGDFLNKNLTL
jgi:hypothetical protein